MIIYDKEGNEVEIEHSIDMKAAIATGQYAMEAPKKKAGRPRVAKEFVKVLVEAPPAKPAVKKIEKLVEKPAVKPPAKKLLQKKDPIK
jgi:hypothetical protein